jgi:hypothetical protein
LETGHPDIPLSQQRLWKVSRDGTVTTAHRFPEKTLPRSLSCVEGRPWLAVMKNYTRTSHASPEWEIQRFDLDGTPLRALAIPAHQITVGSQTGMIWLRTEAAILRIDRDGNPLLTIPLSPESRSVQIVAF